MRKTISTVGLIIWSIAVQSTTVIYNFDTGIDASISGTGLTAGTITYNDGSPDSVEQAWNPTSASGEYELNIGQRGVGDSGVADKILTLVSHLS